MYELPVDLSHRNASYIQYKIQAVCGLILMLCTPFGTAIPLSSFYSYGSEHGDSVLPPSDDGTSSAIQLPTAFLFYGNSFTNIFVNNNGDLTFNEAYSYYTPLTFPIKGKPMIAPFFADVDTRGTGKVWYRATTNSTLLAKAVNDIPSNLTGPNFTPLWLFIATWDHVGYYTNHTDKTNTFQCILTTDNNKSYAIFQYADGLIQWTTATGVSSGGVGDIGAQVGLNAGDGVNYANVQDSRRPAIINITSTTNVGVPGQWIFSVSTGEPSIRCSSQPIVYGVQGDSVQLNCTFSGLPVPNITWTLPDGSIVVFQSHYKVQSTNTSTSLTISPLGPGDAGTYTCTATNSNGTSSASIQLIVQSPPTIQCPQPIIYGIQGQRVQLNCTFDGLPVPAITWISPNGSVLAFQSHFSVQSTNTSTSLIISPLGPGDSGTYNCTASNPIGVSSASIQLIFQTSSSVEALAIGVPVSIVGMAVLILIIIIISAAVRRKTMQRASRKRIWRSKDASAAIEMKTSPIYSLETTAGHMKTAKSIVKYYRQQFEDILVNYDQLKMDEQPCGSGEFGVVYHATLTTKDGPTQEVAVKSTKNTCSEDVIKAFLEECVSMKSFQHSNVLELVGMCLNSPNGVPLMVLPFMANGNLKKYLQQARRYEKIDQYPEGLPCCILISMCLDIAKGMSYLADKRIVHRDLAARNCLVDSDLVIKVGDFGLSRDIYTGNYYRMTKTNKCPVKWMPPETIRDGISTEKSDVWAYGVTCWEVFSIGTTPYPGLENFEMLDHLDKGLRLQQPNLCPDAIFTLMKGCWIEDPQTRLTFAQLESELELLSGSVKSIAEQL